MTYIITGASSAIGLATIALIVEKGKDNEVICVTREPDSLKQRLESLGLFSKNIIICKCDLSKIDSLNSELCPILDEIGSLDGLINIAGLFIGKRFDDITLDEIDTLINCNIVSLINIFKITLPVLQKYCTPVVNISSTLGIHTIDGIYSSVYDALKSSVITFTKSMAKEFGLFGIRVNCVSPGVLDPCDKYSFNKVGYEQLLYVNKLCQQQSLPFLGQSKNIASAIMFLLSEESNWTTGCNLVVDGGMNL